MYTRLVASFVAFFCVFASNNPDGRRKLSESILDNVTSLDVGEIIKDMAEQGLDYWVGWPEDYRIAAKHIDPDLYQKTPWGYNEVEFGSRKLLSVSGHRSRMHRVLIADSAPGPTHSQSPPPQPSDRAPPSPNKPSKLSKKTPRFPSQSEDTNQEYILAALVACSVLAVLLSAVLCCVCLKKEKRVEPTDGTRDERPLLNLSASNSSAGSSGHTIGNSSGKDFKAPSILGVSAMDLNRDQSQLSKSGSNKDFTEVKKNTPHLLPLPPGRTGAADLPKPPDLPPPPPPKPPAPAAPPPPPPKSGSRPPNPPPPGPTKLSPLGPHHHRLSSDGSNESDAPKTKLKPFFWDKVLASPNHSMVWHEIKAGSFQFNEEMMETLFGYTQPGDKNKNDHKRDSSPYDSPPQFVQIIDPKKSQNLAILLKALNVTTEEVCEALKEGNELPSELTQTLLRMAPTEDEELKLRLYDGDINDLGPAERFLKVVVDIPFAFKRLESLLFLSTFEEEFSSTKESLATLEVACKELRSSRLFLKLLEAVLKTGNRMNDGTYRGGAQAFKLDTLLKLSDVKGTDGKTTLLNFVVQEIIRSEGVREARRLKESKSDSSFTTEDLAEDSYDEIEEYHRSLGLQVVSSLSSELQNVKKAALIDNDSQTETVHKLGQALEKTKAFLDQDMKDLGEEHAFRDALTSFVGLCESDFQWLKEEEKRIMLLVKSTGDYFHGRAGREEGSHLFVIVRDFLLMLDKSCLDVKNSSRFLSKMARKEASPVPASPSTLEMMHRRQLFPAMRGPQMDADFSSDDES